MSESTSNGFTDRTFCPAVSRDGRRCDFAEHPGAVHWSWIDGELQFWQALPDADEAWRNQGANEDPLRDAPQALKGGKAAAMSRWLGVGQHHVLFVVDEASQLLEKVQGTQEANETMQNSRDLFRRGLAPEDYNRPLVEALTSDGRFAYGLLESPYSSGNYVPVVHETVPGSGETPRREVIVADSIREVFVPGHRGGCQGDCCRDGYSEDTSYPECWTWEQVRTGIAEKYRAWKDWAL